MRTDLAADDQIQLEILHRWVEDFLDRGLQAVDLVDEQHVARLEVGEDRGEIPGALDHRAGGGAEADAKLAGDDLGQRGLAEAGGAMKKHMVKGFAAMAGGLDEDGEVLAAGLLAGEVGERLRAQGGFGGVLLGPGGGDGAFAPRA